MTRLLFLCVLVSFFCRTSFAWKGLWNYSLPSNPCYTVKTFRLDPDEALELFGVESSIDYYYSYGSFIFDSRDTTPISGILRLTEEDAFTQHKLSIEFLNFCDHAHQQLLVEASRAFRLRDNGPCPDGSLCPAAFISTQAPNALCMENFAAFVKVGLRIEIPENNNHYIDILPQKVPTQNH